MRNKWIVHGVALTVAAAGLVLMPARAAAPEQEHSSAELRGRVHDAALLARTMRHDRKLARLLGRAKGVLLIPHYGRGGIVIGGVGGSALLMVRRGNEWYGPVFYQLGGVNIGIQLGASAGPVALLLMNDRAVAEVESHPSKWSWDAAAGLKLVKYGGQAENSGNPGDVILWSHLRGLYGGVSLGARDLSLDGSANRTYYHRPLRPKQILSGTARLSHSQSLHAALAGAGRRSLDGPKDAPRGQPEGPKPKDPKDAKDH